MKLSGKMVLYFTYATIAMALVTALVVGFESQPAPVPEKPPAPIVLKALYSEDTPVLVAVGNQPKGWLSRSEYMELLMRHKGDSRHICSELFPSATVPTTVQGYAYFSSQEWSPGTVVLVFFSYEKLSDVVRDNIHDELFEYLQGAAHDASHPFQGNCPYPGHEVVINSGYVDQPVW